MGPTDHVFLYRNQPLSKDLIHGRLKAAGERVGVRLPAHRLRHTCATQLLNAGCPVTSIQKLLGHKKLNTTMIYPRATTRPWKRITSPPWDASSSAWSWSDESGDTYHSCSESERGSSLDL